MTWPWYERYDFCFEKYHLILERYCCEALSGRIDRKILLNISKILYWIGCNIIFLGCQTVQWTVRWKDSLWLWSGKWGTSFAIIFPNLQGSFTIFCDHLRSLTNSKDYTKTFMSHSSFRISKRMFSAFGERLLYFLTYQKVYIAVWKELGFCAVPKKIIYVVRQSPL